MKQAILFLLFTVAINSSAFSQEMPTKSQWGKVVQQLGTTTINVQYSRPVVNNRTIWGDLVPYDKVWRLGANEATTLTTDDDIAVGGKKLAKGTYALFATPGKDSWKIHFNSYTDAWGAGDYDAKNDVLVVTVSTKTGTEKVEAMRFTFENAIGASGDLVLSWDQLSVIIPITELTK